MRRLAAEDLVASLVEAEVAEAQDVAGQLAAGAPQDGLHPGDDLGEAERLRHVVVAAGAQRVDLVLDRVLGGQEEDRRLEAALAQTPPDLDPLDVREHPVEHDQVRLELDDGGSARARSPPRDVEALVAERGRDGVDDRGLVVDDEHLRRCRWLSVRRCSWDQPATDPGSGLRNPSESCESPVNSVSPATAAARNTGVLQSLKYVQRLN